MIDRILDAILPPGYTLGLFLAHLAALAVMVVGITLIAKGLGITS